MIARKRSRWRWFQARPARLAGRRRPGSRRTSGSRSSAVRSSWLTRLRKSSFILVEAGQLLVGAAQLFGRRPRVRATCAPTPGWRRIACWVSFEDLDHRVEADGLSLGDAGYQRAAEAGTDRRGQAGVPHGAISAGSGSPAAVERPAAAKRIVGEDAVRSAPAPGRAGSADAGPGSWPDRRSAPATWASAGRKAVDEDRALEALKRGGLGQHRHT